MDRSEAHRVMTEVFGDDVHAKRVKSLGDGALGVLEAGAVGIHAIGQGLAAACNLAEKHAIKQVDRLIGNKGVSVDALSPAWVEHVLGDREEVVANFDWTEFDADDQSMIVLAAQTGHGRAMPLLWKSVVKSELAGKRNDTEDAVLERFRELVPRSVKVTVVADRGFGDTALYDHLDRMGFFYVIRFRSNIIVEHDGVRPSVTSYAP